MAGAMPWPRGEREVAARNRRTAWLLVGWIVFLCLVSLVVIWVRN